MRTMNFPQSSNKERPLINQLYLRLDISLFDFSEAQLLEYARTVERFIKERYDASFVIRYEDVQGHSVRKQPFGTTLQNELLRCNRNDPRECAISYHGFLKTEAMNTQADMKQAWANAFRRGCAWYSTYTVGENPQEIAFPEMPEGSQLMNDPQIRSKYFHSIAAYSQTDKQWLSDMLSWDLFGSITASFHENASGEEQAMGDISLCFSCFMLDDLIQDTYDALKILAIEIDAIAPFMFAAIGYGASYESSYDLCSQPVEFPSNRDHYTYLKEYGNQLGWFNLIPAEWDKRLPSNHPDIIEKDRTEQGSVIYELRGKASPYRAKDLLQIRKYLTPVLLPMKNETVYYIHIAPHIAPIEANEIGIKQHERSGEYYPVFLPNKENVSRES